MKGLPSSMNFVGKILMVGELEPFLLTAAQTKIKLDCYAIANVHQDTQDSDLIATKIAQLILPIKDYSAEDQSMEEDQVTHITSAIGSVILACLADAIKTIEY